MVQAVIEVAPDAGVPTCMYLLGAMGFALATVTTGLVMAVKAAWKERDARIADREALITKLDEEREARSRTRAMRDTKGGTP